jgi:hypothetical protein
LILIGQLAVAEWSIDLSRRIQQTRTQDLKDPDAAAMQLDPPKKNFIQSLFESGQISQEIVILNTDKGFVPSTVRLKKGLAYQIHVVNVNEKEKNVSFVLDSFSEHHATFYGKIKSFVVRPQKEGVFRFVSPETSAQGKLVVYPGNGNEPEVRMPASEE